MLNRYISSYITISALFLIAVEPTVMSSWNQAQPAGGLGQPGIAVSTLNRPLPFEAGEVLTYNIGFSKLILSGSIGQLKLIVRNNQTAARKDPIPAPVSAKESQAGPSSGSKEPANPQTPITSPATHLAAQRDATSIEFGAEVASKGFFTRLFGIKIEDRYGAVIGSDDFGLLRSWKDLDQGDVHRHFETRVDRERGAFLYSETDRNGRGAPKVKTGASPKWVLDLLSAVYFIRTRELEERNPITLPIADAGQVYMIDVVPVKREEVEVEAGKFKSIQLDLKIFDGKYIKRSGQLLVWLSDDSRRLPVRARLKSSGTTVNITLARHEHAR